MFSKIVKTDYPPSGDAVMIWDGQCGFCAYWVSRWETITGKKVQYRPYQEAAQDFPDINPKYFKEASRLIDGQGMVFSGPRSAYRTLTYGKSKWAFLDRWYDRYTWFERASDKIYNWVAHNRGFLFKLTKAMFGSNPKEVRPFWAIYLALLVYLLYLFFRL